jgi:hypothetical protein
MFLRPSSQKHAKFSGFRYFFTNFYIRKNSIKITVSILFSFYERKIDFKSKLIKFCLCHFVKFEIKILRKTKPSLRRSGWSDESKFLIVFFKRMIKILIHVMSRICRNYDKSREKTRKSV